MDGLKILPAFHQIFVRWSNWCFAALTEWPLSSGINWNNCLGTFTKSECPGIIVQNENDVPRSCRCWSTMAVGRLITGPGSRLTGNHWAMLSGETRRFPSILSNGWFQDVLLSPLSNSGDTLPEAWKWRSSFFKTIVMWNRCAWYRKMLKLKRLVEWRWTHLGYPRRSIMKFQFLNFAHRPSPFGIQALNLSDWRKALRSVLYLSVKLHNADLMVTKWPLSTYWPEEVYRSSHLDVVTYIWIKDGKPVVTPISGYGIGNYYPLWKKLSKRRLS